MKQYKAVKGSRLKDKDAKIIGGFLDKQFGGQFTADQVVEAARKKRSPIHRYFDWDDTSAAEKYRLNQARELARFITVVVKIDDREVETRAFHHVIVEEGEGEYTSISVILKDEDKSEQVISKAKGELKGWRRRYAEYRQVFGGVLEEIEKVVG